MAKDKKESPVRAVDHWCTECNNNWLIKTEAYYCPVCKCTILEVEKLRS